MKLTYVTGPTGEDGSPRIYVTDRAEGPTAGVQGYLIDATSKSTAEPPLPGGEDIVEVPVELIHKASAALKAMGL
jgi:hypothetical protein